MNTSHSLLWRCATLALAATVLPAAAQTPAVPPSRPFPAPLAMAVTNLPPGAVEAVLTNGVALPEGIPADLIGEPDDASQTNLPAGDEGLSDTNNPGADGIQRPGRLTSRSEYDGRQSRSRRFSRPDAQRPGFTNSSSSATGTNAPGKYDYAAFRLINDRNIFNPNRRPYRPGQITEPVAPPNSDSLSLVGVMSYESGNFAFFTGNQSRYEKTTQVADAIAGYRVTEINVSSNSVKLESGTNRLELQVGMSLRRDAEGVWRPSRRSAIFAAYDSTPNPGSDASAPAGASARGPASADEDNEVIKRLMRQREQQ